MFEFLYSLFADQPGPKIICTKIPTLPNLFLFAPLVDDVRHPRAICRFLKERTMTTKEPIKRKFLTISSSLHRCSSNLSQCCSQKVVKGSLGSWLLQYPPISLGNLIKPHLKHLATDWMNNYA